MKKSSIKVKNTKIGTFEPHQLAKSLEKIGIKITFIEDDKKNVKYNNISLIAGYSNKELFIR